MHVHGKKIQQVIKDGLCAQRGSRGGINGETRGALYDTMYKSKRKARKQPGKQKKKAKPGHMNVSTKTTN